MGNPFNPQFNPAFGSGNSGLGTLTQADFLTEILAGLGNRTDISTQRLINNLNLAQSRLSRAYDFTELQIYQTPLVSFTGVPVVDKMQALPIGIKTIHSIVLIDNTGVPSSLANSRKMIEKPWRWFDKKFPTPEFDAPGWPEIYTRWGGNIVIYPVPQAAYNFGIRSNDWPTPFTVTNSTQTSDFDNKDDILIDLTLARIFKSLGPPMADQADSYLQAAIVATKEAISRENTRPDMEISKDIPGAATISSQYWVDPFIRGVYTE